MFYLCPVTSSIIQSITFPNKSGTKEDSHPGLSLINGTLRLYQLNPTIPQSALIFIDLNFIFLQIIFFFFCLYIFFFNLTDICSEPAQQHGAPFFLIIYDSYQFPHLFYGRVLMPALIKSDVKDLCRGRFPPMLLLFLIETGKAFEE